MKTLLKTISLLCLIMVCIEIADTKVRRRKLCHMLEPTYFCAQRGRVFTSVEGGTGIVTDERGYDAICHYNLVSIPNCVRGWSKRCLTEWQQELVDAYYVQSNLGSFGSQCSGEKRKKFLTHSPCLHEKVKKSKSYREQCVQEIQAGFEYIHEKFINHTMLTKLRGICCTYNRWEHCITAHLLKECGPISDEIIVDFIRTASLELTSQMCAQEIYNYKGEACREVLSPKGIKPKGFKSDAYFSYVFSMWCPNVGYGIIPERD